MRSMVVNLMWKHFFTKTNNKNVNVLISWEQRHSAEKINGTAYHVYGYNYSLNNLSINPSIKKDQSSQNQALLVS